MKMPPSGYMVVTPASFPDLLSHWSEGELANDLSVPVTSARSMKWRGSVSPAYWTRLADAAEAKGLSINAATLARFAERKPRTRAAAQ